MKRVHIGAGSVYLRDWVNVDLDNVGIALAKERPDLVAKLGTTEKDYYQRHKDKTIEKLRDSAAKVAGVCDKYGKFDSLPFAEASVDEILSRQVFEHLSITEAKRALIECDRNSARDARWERQ